MTPEEKMVSMWPPEKKVEWINKRHSGSMKLVQVEINQILKSNRNLDFKAKAFIKIIDRVTDLFAPIAPCKKGCAFCCYQAVAITEWEADQIESVSKIKKTNYKPRDAFEEGRNMRTENIKEYTGKACPFLLNNECSVYAVRPFACRTHISLAVTADPCDIKNHPGAKVPYANLQGLTHQAAFMMFSHGQGVGDIRDFFGEQL